MDRPACHFFKIAAALITSLLACACTKLQPVLCEDLGRLASIVKPGDTVRCTFRDGTTRTLKVSIVEPGALIKADGSRVAIAVITRAKIEHVDLAKTILLGLSIVALAAAMVVLSACALGSRSDVAFEPESPHAPPNIGG